ncbi:MAG: transcription elongation factor GreB [Nitrosomonadales bacterium]
MSEKKRSYLTQSGFIILREELNYLLRVERPKIVKDVSWAASNGDRSENGDYIYGKKRLRQIDSRVKYLLTELEDSIIIDPKKQTNRDHVFFGATVDLLNILDDIEIKIQIVGQSEIDTSKGKISWQSPLSKAILGKSIGDIVKIDTPSGFSDYEILDIKYE